MTDKPKAKMGRPRKEIDWVDFEKLCHMHCTLVEAAAWFDCSEDTLERRVVEHYGETFAEVLKKKSSTGKISLRRSMFQKAADGNVTMMIWLSKQHLGMADKVEQKNQVTLEGNLTPEQADAESLQILERLRSRAQKPV